MSLSILKSSFDKILSSSKTECIICGDMNIDLLKTHSDPNAANYLDTLVSNCYLPAIITLPTRVTKTSSTLIDHIFKRISQTEFLGGTIEYDISDHYLNFILLKTVYSKPPKCNITFRNTCDNNLNNFKNAL